MPDVAYFEAVAQLIPVLFIVGVAERYTYAKSAGADSHDLWFAFGTIGTLFCFANGEIAALGAIASQAPTQPQTVAATIGLAAGGSLLLITPMMSTLDQTLDHYTETAPNGRTRRIAWYGMPALGILVCLLPFIVAVIWLFTLFYI